MTQTHSNTKERKYTHLTDIERGQIAAYLEEGLKLSDIAKKMGRHKSTISREKRRDPSNKSIPIANLLRSIFLMLVRVFTKRIRKIAALILPSWRHGSLSNLRKIKS